MNSNNATTVPLSKLIGSLFYLLLFPVILFLLAGDWRWTEGWVYSVIFLLMSYGTLIYLYFQWRMALHKMSLSLRSRRKQSPRSGRQHKAWGASPRSNHENSPSP